VKQTSGFRAERGQLPPGQETTAAPRELFPYFETQRTYIVQHPTYGSVKRRTAFCTMTVINVLM
jgi:hypothetical protein